jgi:quercetin dioxygenase-like cupin family protein
MTNEAVQKRTITVIDTSSSPRQPIPEGVVRHILSPSNDRTRVEVSKYEIDAGKQLHLSPVDRTQLVYILEGNDAEVTYSSGGKSTAYPAQKGCGVYLEPNEEAVIKAASSPLTLLQVIVPKYTGKAIDAETPTGYFFDEAKLQVLIDEGRKRIRTFWVNKETGLSRSWDLQVGRMHYEPQGCAPRHVHRASKTSSVTPEHFYLIEDGIGELKHDNGSYRLGPGDLVLIPAGEWHQLFASDTGLNYFEFQGPFDFSTTMDRDPLGKNWYIQGTDDGSGKPRLWVQS